MKKGEKIERKIEFTRHVRHCCGKRRDSNVSSFCVYLRLPQQKQTQTITPPQRLVPLTNNRQIFAKVQISSDDTVDSL